MHADATTVTTNTINATFISIITYTTTAKAKDVKVIMSGNPESIFNHIGRHKDVLSVSQ